MKQVTSRISLANRIGLSTSPIVIPQYIFKANKIKVTIKTIMGNNRKRRQIYQKNNRIRQSK